MPVSTGHFRSMLLSLLDEAGRLGFSYVGITAGALHRRVGGYPGSGHRIPVCSAAMRRVMGPSDRIVEPPPSGNGASLLIQFALPRSAGTGGRPDPPLGAPGGQS
jgi:5-methylcytosine-specific restriction protein A